ncbi:hypothetical protein [Bradyrhizobium sp. JYMT SZCCT0180]|uniref:hypothetical protein n=1 Tax=Bradyrhizobium sp. JYMT SZCCT0180 TaxID=2807666 RepID=UPI001BAA33D3|nr:hypothetical protein [Bradyrhizobium sp. JYMT SZCCT0180]MBR1215593.1 hypothetical protein [Bradyrhizobium sp. JYMT SZCCT0180]
MKEYRAYLIDRDGHIKRRVDLVCEAEEVAVGRAKLLVDGHDVELWLGTEKIANFRRLDS